MSRAVWKGSLSFGLINIPVALHTAVREHRPHFRLLHKKDQSPLRSDRVCETEGAVVPWEEVVKGYEYEKGKFVVLTEEDFQTAAVEKSKSIDILDFVPTGEIDARFFELPYYVLPDPGGERAYALLREALRDSGKVGIARVILREAQHLSAIVVVEDAMLLVLMRFADELVSPSDFEFPSAGEVPREELDTAKALIENLADRFTPDKYPDEYRQNIMRVIKAKLKGKRPALQSEEHPPQQAEVISLMERLQQSLEAAAASKKAPAAHETKKVATHDKEPAAAHQAEAPPAHGHKKTKAALS